MKRWLRTWGLTVFAWLSCAIGIAGVIGSHSVPKWVTILWIVYTAAWVGIARITNATVGIQADTIRILRRHRDLLDQQRKAGLS